MPRTSGDPNPPWRIPDLNEPSYSQSLERGLAILESFTAEQPWMGIADIADSLGMSRSTTHRYASTLVKLGYLEQGARRKYRLGLGVSRLGLEAVNATGLREHAHEDMAQLSIRVSCDVSLAVLDGADVIYLDRVHRLRRGRPDLDLQAGSRLPAYCTALGKVLLAYSSEPVREEVLAETELVQVGPNTVGNLAELRTELELVAEEGIALEDQERTEGVIGIAAPIYNEGGECIAAMDLSVRSSDASIEEFAGALSPHLIAAADHVSSRLGYRLEG
jgi:IclR family transcriptional regulator, pca regulon regulatory protein